VSGVEGVEREDYDDGEARVAFSAWIGLTGSRMPVK